MSGYPCQLNRSMQHPCIHLILLMLFWKYPSPGLYSIRPYRAVFSLIKFPERIRPLKLLHLDSELVLRPPIESTAVTGKVKYWEPSYRQSEPFDAMSDVWTVLKSNIRSNELYTYLNFGE